MRRAKLVLKKPTKKLAPREAEVLTLLACGNSPAEISLILSLRNTTVKDYIMRARRKLQARKTTHAVALAMALGLITPFGRRTPKGAAE